MGHGSPQSKVIRETNGHTEPLATGPKRPNRIEANSFAAGITEWYGRRVTEKNGLKEKAKPIIKQGPALSRASHKRKGNWKTVKDERQIEQACHGKHMSSRQVLDTHGKVACARPKHHQPVPSQYRTW